MSETATLLCIHGFDSEKSSKRSKSRRTRGAAKKPTESSDSKITSSKVCGHKRARESEKENYSERNLKRAKVHVICGANAHL